MFNVRTVSRRMDVKCAMKCDVLTTAHSVVTRLYTRGLVVWESCSALFICLQVCDEYKVPAALSVCMFAHLYMCVS